MKMESVLGGLFESCCVLPPLSNKQYVEGDFVFGGFAVWILWGRKMVL